MKIVFKAGQQRIYELKRERWNWLPMREGEDLIYFRIHNCFFIYDEKTKELNNVRDLFYS